ncbi:hypothetical protein EWS82_13265, partial [Staphylococcus xylosus]|nr:hypothetical protein [Staphylococcus xylosus]
NISASSVIVMIETKDAVENVDEIAAVEGVDVLLVGSNDLSIELGVPGGFQTPAFRSALESVSKACRRHGKTMGLAGLYDNYEIQNWAINISASSVIVMIETKDAVENVDEIAAVEGVDVLL